MIKKKRSRAESGNFFYIVPLYHRKIFLYAHVFEMYECTILNKNL